MHLAVRSVFQPKWTPRIQDEWIRNVLANRPDLKLEQLARTRTLMETWGRDWEVPDYEDAHFRLALPDPDDCHVLAAAIAGRVPVIVTFNLAHFPEVALQPHGVRAIHPDAFACELLEAEPEAFLLAAPTHRAALKNPTKSVGDYMGALCRAGLVETTARIDPYHDQL